MNQIQVHHETSRLWLQTLNEVQKKAALHDQGPLVVFAGAGSGKTRVITTRIALLIDSGVLPSRILAVTFTNKAAGEMRERATALTLDAGLATIATFHSACARWLREFASELGFTSDFTVYDDNDSQSVIKAVLKELNIKIEESVSDYKSAIQRMKNLGWSPREAETFESEYQSQFPPYYVKIYRSYQEKLALANAMDFSDLLLNMLLLLRSHKGVRAALQRRYSYVLVDEYQDTNPTQFELVALLLGDSKNLMVVGDDDQSIYSWRGANPSNIINFKTHFPTAIECRLEQNYRCTSNIVNAANAVIQNNKVRAAKTLWTENRSGDLIQYVQEIDGEAESWNVIDLIKREKNIYPLTDVAVFYRTNSQSRSLEENLRRQNIPYQIYGSLRFYDRAEIKDILAYVRLTINDGDDVAFRRIVNVPTRGIGDKAVENLNEIAKAKGLSLLKAARECVSTNVPKLGAKFKVFVDIVDSLKSRCEESAPHEIVPTILELTDYRRHLDTKHPEEAKDKLGNVHELAAAMSDFHEANPEVKLSQWLQDISMTGSESESSTGVTLMTLHSAKGLEFKRVYIVGVEDGLLPHLNSMDYSEDLEEERRLMYVGMTRAKEKLSLFSARKRRVYNNWMANGPSRFLNEIPKEFLHMTGVEQEVSIEKERSSFSGWADDDAVDEGSKVKHPTFGRGIVEAVESEFGSKKAIVRFDSFGLRKVSLSQLQTGETRYEYDLD